MHDLSSRGVRYSGLAGVELQGWLRVATAGRTQIAADVRGSFSGAIFGPTCVLQVWLEDRQIGLAQERLALTPQDRSDTSLVVGAELQPGVYKLRLWTACHPPSGPKNARVTIDLLTKAPGELNLRGFTGEDLLHAPPK